MVLLPSCARSEASASRTPRFVDDTPVSGVDHRYDGEFEYFVGGGVAAFDCDDDGQDDLFLAGGSEPAALYHNDSPIGGALRFSPVPSPVTDLTAVTGAYPLDLDSDGHTDLVVLRREGDVVLRGLGGCRFEAATDQLGIDLRPGWTTAFSATWEGSSSCRRSPSAAISCREGTRATTAGCCGPTPRGFATPPRSRCRPGTARCRCCSATGATRAAATSASRTTATTTSSGEEQLWRIDPGEPPTAYTEADGWRPLQIWGMGIASQDITGDGLPEVFLTSQGDNKLQTLASGAQRPDYRDIALSLGVTAQRPYTGGDVLPSTAWHPEFADVNNDGISDLLVTKGNVDAQVDQASRDPSNLLIGRPDGSFTEQGEAAGIVDFERARGAAVVDLNLDGLLDLVVVHRRANVTLWRNVGRGSAAEPAAMGHWIDVRLAAAGAERRRHGRLDRRTRWRRAPPPERSRSAAGTSAASSAGCIPASARPATPRCACSGPTAPSDHG